VKTRIFFTEGVDSHFGNTEILPDGQISCGGIVRLADLIVAEAVRKGQLKPVLAASHVAEPIPLSAVYPQGRHRMPKVRAFVDFLVARFGQAPWRFALTPSP
jgi:DNA-binding transcriptional LysR family regulator